MILPGSHLTKPIYRDVFPVEYGVTLLVGEVDD